MKLAVPLVVMLFAEALFLLLVLALDVLPFKYIVLLISALAIADAVIIALFNTPSKRGLRRLSGLIVLVLVMNLLLVGDFYVYSTYDTLSKISGNKATWEYYYLLALEGGSYEEIDDIEGQTIHAPEMDSKQLNEAKERLVTKESVSYENHPDFMSAAREIFDEDGNKQDNLVLLPKTNYKLVCENVKGYKKNTKILYKIKVKKRSNDNSKAVNVTEDPFNILISGMDNWGTIEESNLSDVNMVMTVNPVSREILLTSIPRDSYIPFHSYGMKDKLTHTGIYGEEETKQTIEDFLGIDINYTFKVNFTMFCEVVDAIGGIRVYNDQDFYSHPKGWHYKEGWHNMDGHYALWFARERKSFKDGDMQRNKNQQKVMKATIKKVTSSKVILTKYTDILNAVEDYMSTSLTDKDIKKLVKMQLSDMRGWDIKTANVVGATGGAPCFSMGGQQLSVVFPSEESVNEAKEAIHDVMYPAENVKETDGENKEKNN